MVAAVQLHPGVNTVGGEQQHEGADEDFDRAGLALATEEKLKADKENDEVEHRVGDRGGFGQQRAGSTGAGSY